MFFSVASTCLARPARFPDTLSMTSLAAADLPILTSHRGVSGMRNRMQSCTAAGTAPKPTIHLHAVSLLPYSPNSQPTMYATTWPSVINTTVVVTRRPLCAAGASSAMYSGTTKLAPPTAAPTMERPATMLTTVVLPAWSRAPVMKRISATRMTRLRPRESASSEANGEMSRADSEVHEVMMDLSSEVSVLPESEVPIDTRVAEMTPVSSLVGGQRLSYGTPPRH